MKQIHNYILENFEDSDDRVKLFLSRVYEDCEAQHEDLSNYFFCCLDLLANQLRLYFMALDYINENKKLSSEDSYKRVAKEPCIAILNNAHKEILNILQKLSLSPFEKAKLKRISSPSGGDDKEFLDNLIN